MIINSGCLYGSYSTLVISLSRCFEYISLYPFIIDVTRMSFHPITLTLPSASTWNESGPGRYMNTNVVFGQPLNYIQVNPGSRSTKLARTNAAISRLLQLDVTANAVTTRRTASMQLVLQVDDGFTTTNLDDMLTQLNEFVTGTSLNRILNGER